MTKRGSVHFQVSTLVLLAVLSIHAGNFARGAESAGSNIPILGEVIVTATKRAEREQDVPSSISVVGAAQLQDLHAAALEDIASYAPGLVISGGGSPGQTSIILRGLNSLQNGSLVATLIDDSPVGSSSGWVREDGFQLDLLPYDIERIEILRGPQGTLYGENAMGGVLKYVTKSPSLHEFEAEIGGDGFGVKNAGNLGYAARGMVSAPLIDGKLALRVSVYDRKTPGYIDDPQRGAKGENGLTQRGAHIALLAQASDDLSIKLQQLYQQTDSQGNAYVEAARLGAATPYRVGGWLNGDLVNNHVLPEPFITDVNFLSATINWHLSFADFTSASSYSNKHLFQKTDASNNIGFLLPILDPANPPTTSTLTRFNLRLATKRYTQEFRLASPSDQRFAWLLGAFYTNEKAYNHQVLDALDNSQMLIPSLSPFEDYTAPTTYKETAVFANATYRIIDRFDVTAGIRLSKNKQTNEQDFGGFLLFPPGVTFATSADNVITYAASPRYHLNQDNMLYLRVATGYRPGGPNDVIPGYPEIPSQTKADRMLNYEAGIKSTFLDRRAALDFAVYKVRWTDLQSSAFTHDGAFGYSVNNGTASSQGVELSTSYEPIDRLNLTVNAAYTDARITQSVPAVGAVDGAHLPTAPKWTASAMLDYSFAAVAAWTPRFNGGVRYIDTQYTQVSSISTAAILPGYTLVDLNASLTDGRYTVALYAKNLTDERVFSSAKNQTDLRYNTHFFFGSIVQPRLIGVSVDFKF